METRENILKELQEIAPMLSKMEKKNFYSVPENYFLNFKNGILEQVKLSGVKQELKTVAPELLKVERRSTVEVPTGYFNSFSTDLMKKIRAEEVAAELREIAPALSEAEKINLLEVPANYFNAFPQQMMKRIASEQKAKEVSSPQWFEALNNVLENITAVIFKPKYSFAFAGMTTMIIVGVMFFMKVEEQCADLDCKMAALSNEELNTYLDSNIDESSEEIFELNADVSLLSTDNNTVSNTFNNLSDEELNKALLD